MMKHIVLHNLNNTLDSILHSQQHGYSDRYGPYTITVAFPRWTHSGRSIHHDSCRILTWFHPLPSYLQTAYYILHHLDAYFSAWFRVIFGQLSHYGQCRSIRISSSYFMHGIVCLPILRMLRTRCSLSYISVDLFHQFQQLHKRRSFFLFFKGFL